MLWFHSNPHCMIPVGQEVWIKDRGEEGVMKEKQLTPHSFTVTFPTEMGCCNLQVVNKLPSPQLKND